MTVIVALIGLFLWWTLRQGNARRRSRVASEMLGAEKFKDRQYRRDTNSAKLRLITGGRSR